MNNYKGLFIVLEGGEGSGKTTQARMLSEFFTKIAVPNLLTHEPGDTNLGYDLRRLLLDRDREPMSQRAEAMLFAADRAEHVEKLIVPALERGEVVICDRYIASSIAYQSSGMGVSEAAVTFLSTWGSRDLQPDATYFLDIDPQLGLERANNAKKTKDRMESQDLTFHERVRQGFLDQRNESWVYIDAGRTPIDIVHEIIADHATRIYREKVMTYSSEGVKVVYPRCVDRNCNSLLEPMVRKGYYRCPFDHGILILTRETNEFNAS